MIRGIVGGVVDSWGGGEVGCVVGAGQQRRNIVRGVGERRLGQGSRWVAGCNTIVAAVVANVVAVAVVAVVDVGWIMIGVVVSQEPDGAGGLAMVLAEVGVVVVVVVVAVERCIVAAAVELGC